VLENGSSCLLPVVVSARHGAARFSDSGRYDSIFSVRSITVEVDGSENESVGGNESPGKDESSTLIFSNAMA
jgi:hypothetical protein